MISAERLLLKRQRHLKWRALDRLETVLMMLCGLLLFGFCSTVILDIITREIGRPWLWLQEVTSTFFIYAIFTGTAVATRRSDHLYLTAVADTLVGRARTLVEVATRLVVLGVALCFIYFGWLNFLRGFSSFRMPSMTPIASLYAAIPICGVLVMRAVPIMTTATDGFQCCPLAMPADAHGPCGRRAPRNPTGAA